MDSPEQGYLPYGMAWELPQVLHFGPYADFSDLCSKSVFALCAKLEESDDDSQTA